MGECANAKTSERENAHASERANAHTSKRANTYTSERANAGTSNTTPAEPRYGPTRPLTAPALPQKYAFAMSLGTAAVFIFGRGLWNGS